METEKSEREIIHEAEEKGHEWIVLPPEEGFPFPTIGYRLMHLDSNVLFGMVQTFVGHKEVLRELADNLNSQKAKGNFPFLGNDS